MNTKNILTLAAGYMLLVVAAGCASFQTEIINDPGCVTSIKIGQFTTENPVFNDLFRLDLRKELTRRGFIISDKADHILIGIIDLSMYSSDIIEAKMILQTDSDQIIWSFENQSLSRKDFIWSFAKMIEKQLR